MNGKMNRKSIYKTYEYLIKSNSCDLSISLYMLEQMILGSRPNRKNNTD